VNSRCSRHYLNESFLAIGQKIFTRMMV